MLIDRDPKKVQSYIRGEHFLNHDALNMALG